MFKEESGVTSCDHYKTIGNAAAEQVQ